MQERTGTVNTFSNFHEFLFAFDIGQRGGQFADQFFEFTVRN